ncbi:hypothetical protein ABW20_dc0109224 [Dactylellina cionopaga]|nr:hypothetical protein ABW20_dc0109224 [Dactylellina cionopaga]
MSSYTIAVQVYQTNTNAYFQCVEKTVWNYAQGGTWTDSNGTLLLTMGGSGTCGSLRFTSDSGENFIVTLGVHNYKRWGDIVTNLGADTGVIITPQYYDDVKHKDRCSAREKQLSSYNVSNNKGRKYALEYSVAEGQNLKCNIIIG